MTSSSTASSVRRGDTSTDHQQHILERDWITPFVSNSALGEDTITFGDEEEPDGVDPKDRWIWRTLMDPDFFGPSSSYYAQLAAKLLSAVSAPRMSSSYITRLALFDIKWGTEYRGTWSQIYDQKSARLLNPDDGPVRTGLKGQIEALLEAAKFDNWDGEGAIAVTKRSVEVALEVIELLPGYIGDPEVTCTAHGEIDLDWITGRSSMFTLSICPKGVLAWAALFDEFTCRGTSSWTGELPCPILCCLQQLK